jgi:diguanylate cyclase (GGDEF)-like protein/PAS domain S-box-containing protein
MGRFLASQTSTDLDSGISGTLFRSVVEQCADGVVVVDAAGRIAYLNPAAESLFGYSAKAACGQPLDLLIPETYRKAHRRHVAAFKQSDNRSRRMGDRTVRTYGVAADGHEFPADVSIMQSAGADGPFFVAMVRDISERVAMEHEFQTLANTDPLTGLANRRAFLARAEQEVAEARRYGIPLSAAMVDIDRFKTVNDRFGHATGDRALQMVATRLVETVRKPDVFARWGGEEFVCLLPHTGPDVARTAGERLRRRVEDLTIAEAGRVTVSVGLASLGGESDTIDALIDRADQALYAAKRAGRNKVVLIEADQLVAPRGRNGLAVA